MIMKYIIRESRLEGLFERYMDSYFDLKYNPMTREFRSRVGDTFGDLINGLTEESYKKPPHD